MSDCPYCGRPDDRPVQDVSQHSTGEGVLAWTRCGCGSLQARMLSSGTVRVVARGRPFAPRPQCRAG